MEDKKSIMKNHNIIMENRERANITGVIDIHSFDDELVLAETELGILTIKGLDLKMNKLNLDNNELVVEGKIMALIYSEPDTMKKGGMLGRGKEVWGGIPWYSDGGNEWHWYCQSLKGKTGRYGGYF